MSDRVVTELEAIGLRVDAGESVTREEADALVRSVKRLCKGPFKSERHRAEYQELRSNVGMVATEESAKRGYSIEMLDTLNRNYCGYDFNNIIMEYPLDGNDHLVPCPKCGQEISFRSPRFDLSD